MGTFVGTFVSKVTRTTAAVVVVVVCACAFAVVRRMHADEARHDEAAALASLAEADATIATRRDSRERIQADTAEVEARLAEARSSLDAAEARAEAEASALGVLVEEREARTDALAEVQGQVDAAEGQAAANDALIRALDTCLDGATRAANALSVGDVASAFAAVADARAACDAVGVAIGQ